MMSKFKTADKIGTAIIMKEIAAVKHVMHGKQERCLRAGPHQCKVPSVKMQIRFQGDSLTPECTEGSLELLSIQLYRTS